MTSLERGHEAAGHGTVPRLPLASYAGAVLGIHGWLVGTLVLCLANGEVALVGELLLVGLPISLALSALLVGARECWRPVLGRRQLLAATWGLLLLAVGVLLVVVNHWLAPRLEASPRLMQSLRDLGGVYRTGDFVPAACLAVSTLLLVGVARAARRRPA
jgi:hypothetical protein